MQGGAILSAISIEGTWQASVLGVKKRVKHNLVTKQQQQFKVISIHAFILIFVQKSLGDMYLIIDFNQELVLVLYTQRWVREEEYPSQENKNKKPVIKHCMLIYIIMKSS